MLRLHEFITIIRNTKTIAQQRAEYQKEMAAIRESFGKNQQSLRPRNVTKLLFINMSGQETNFGQMQCLNLITANSLIEKRIGYLGLTQLFHEKSQLLMMATNRLKIDLGSVNNSIVGLVLCVISEICTTELARELYNEVLKCIGNNNAYIRKKAILTSIRLIKKCPEFIPSFLPKIFSCLEQKNHGVLLSCMAFLENVLYLDQAYAKQLGNAVPRIGKLYKMIVQEHNTEYQIGGVQDPFLQVAILKFLRILKKYTNDYDKNLIDILVISHDNVCSRVSSNLKNGANAVLLECFQLFLMVEPTNQLKEMVSNVLAKFISVKDANAKYLSLFNLGLMAKYDLSVVKNHRTTIFQCLTENDNLIRNMALDLLYLIAEQDNASSIVKQLLNTLLSATDEQFIPELALKICLIVQKHSQSRRWHFDTILKVLILADQSVKQQSAKSLVHLITSTPQLQDYCMAKLFFSTCENIQNDALTKLCLYLLGQIGQILLKNKDLNISESNILDLVESIIFRVGVAFDTITYALSSLLKLYEKFPSEKQRIQKMIKSFENHSDLQVQKRACQYIKLIEPEWNQQRNTQICIPIPPFRETAQAFKVIPIGQTKMDIDLRSIKLPKKINVNYEQHINQNQQSEKVQRQVIISTGKQKFTQPLKQNIFEQIMTTQQPKAVFAKKKQPTNIMDDDIFNTITGDAPTTQTVVNQSKISVVQNDDPFRLLNLNGGNNQPTQVNQTLNIGGFDLNFLGLSTPTTTQSQPNTQFGGSNLLGGDLFGFGGSVKQQGSVQNTEFVLKNTHNNQGFNWGNQPVAQNPQSQLYTVTAYDNQHIQIVMKCVKQTNDTTKITAHYTNKTQSLIENLSIAAAVMKHLKLTLNPLNSTTLQPMSKDTVNQTMTVVNSAVGEKAIVLKMKIGYSANGQKFSFEERIANFPSNL